MTKRTKKMSSGVPRHYCVGCFSEVCWPFGVGTMWFGVCLCSRMLWRWDETSVKLLRLRVTNLDFGFGMTYDWVPTLLVSEKPNSWPDCA